MTRTFSQSPLHVIQDDEADDDAVCEAAQELLMEVDVNAVQPLLQRLNRTQDPPWVRAYLVTALGGIIASYDAIAEEIHSNAVSLLLQILNSPEGSNDLRGAAAVAAGIMQVTEAIPSLLQILGSGNSRLSYSAIVALGELRSPDAVPLLIGLLDSDERAIRIATIETLQKIGKDAVSAVPKLRQLVEEGSEVERPAALTALSQIR